MNTCIFVDQATEKVSFHITHRNHKFTNLNKICTDSENLNYVLHLTRTILVCTLAPVRQSHTACPPCTQQSAPPQGFGKHTPPGKTVILHKIAK